MFELMVCGAGGQATRRQSPRLPRSMKRARPLDTDERIDSGVGDEARGARPWSSPEDEGAVCAYSSDLASPRPRRRQDAQVSSRLLRRADERRVSGSHARSVIMVGRRPGTDGGVRLENQRLRVLNQSPRRGRVDDSRRGYGAGGAGGSRPRADRRAAARDAGVPAQSDARARVGNIDDVRAAGARRDAREIEDALNVASPST